MKTNYLKNWELHKTIGGSVVVTGTVYNDIKKRFKDGAQIVTSRVLKINFVEGVVETLNSIYHLDLGATDYE